MDLDVIEGLLEVQEEGVVWMVRKFLSFGVATSVHSFAKKIYEKSEVLGFVSERSKWMNNKE